MIHTCKHAKECGHTHYQVEVGNYKVGIMDMNINRELPSQIPVKPPEINMLTNPIANSIAGVNRIFPRHKVVSQLNTLIADGMAISNVKQHEEGT